MGQPPVGRRETVVPDGEPPPPAARRRPRATIASIAASAASTSGRVAGTGCADPGAAAIPAPPGSTIVPFAVTFRRADDGVPAALGDTAEIVEAIRHRVELVGGTVDQFHKGGKGRLMLRVPQLSKRLAPSRVGALVS